MLALANATNFALAKGVIKSWLFVYAAARFVKGSSSNEYGNLDFSKWDISSMTNLIHIVGVQGVGKTLLALDIIAGLEKRGKTAVSLSNEGLHECGVPIDLAPLHRNAIRLPYTKEARHYDFVIVEHLELPTDIHAQKGDLIIRMEHAV